MEMDLDHRGSPRGDDAVDRRAGAKSSEISYTCQREFTGHSRSVSSVKFSEDGSCIASASADCSIKLWHVSTGRHLRTIEGHTLGISDVAWSPDGGLLASASDDTTVRLWDAASGRPSCGPLKGHLHYVFSVNFSPRANILASSSFDESVRLWDIRASRCLRAIPAHSEPVTSCHFNNDGTVLVTGSYDGLIRMWDVGSGQCLKTIQEAGTPPVSGVRFSPNGKFLLCATLDGKLRLWDAVASKCVKSFSGHKNHRLCAAPVFSVGGPRQEVAVGSEDGNVHVWDVQTRAPVHVIQRAHEGSAVLALDSCASRDLLATGGTGGNCAVKVWARGPSLPSSTTT